MKLIKITYMKRLTMKCAVMCAMVGLTFGACQQKGGQKGQEDAATAQQAVQATLTDLQGEWIIQEVNGKALPTDMERTPFLAFDTETMRVHGFTACNFANGAIGQTEGNPASLQMPQMVTTMMAGPHLEWEQEILKATEQVASFRLDGQQLSLLDAAGKELLRLQKNTGEKLSR